LGGAEGPRWYRSEWSGSGVQNLAVVRRWSVDDCLAGVRVDKPSRKPLRRGEGGNNEASVEKVVGPSQDVFTFERRRRSHGCGWLRGMQANLNLARRENCETSLRTKDRDGTAAPGSMSRGG
jgi:hypothetical protein